MTFPNFTLSLRVLDQPQNEKNRRPLMNVLRSMAEHLEGWKFAGGSPSEVRYMLL